MPSLPWATDVSGLTFSHLAFAFLVSLSVYVHRVFVRLSASVTIIPLPLVVGETEREISGKKRQQLLAFQNTKM